MTSVRLVNTPWGQFELTVAGDKPWPAPWDHCGPPQADEIERWRDLAEAAAAAGETEASVGFLKMARLTREAIRSGRPKGYQLKSAAREVAYLYVDLWMQNKIATQQEAIEAAIERHIIPRKDDTKKFADAVRKAINRLSKTG
jgi:hypothetical protein